MEPRKAKKTLMEFRSRLLGREEEIGGSLAVSLEEEVDEESSDQHPADVGTVTFTRELDLTLRGNVERLLAQVDRALEKIDEGTYGRCDRCGRRIDPGRMDAVPYATLCMDHQRELERSGGIS
ncbi:MAG: TraR/DksA C4-type zinc finger protein [Thermoleophilia bacterium]|nr:TraR/DksA C4-type zinc finger protein [Thermoleophilia bacterium]